MAHELLAPVVDQHLLGAGPVVPICLQAGEPATDHAPVVALTGRRGARVVGHPGAAPAGGRPSDRRVVGVEDVYVGLGREVRIERDAEQPPVRVVVDLRSQVGEDRGRRVAEAVEDLDQAALLGDEHAAIGREAHGGRLVEAAEDHRLREPGRLGGAGGRGSIARVERRGATRDVRRARGFPGAAGHEGRGKEGDGDHQRHPAWADPNRSVRPALHVSSPPLSRLVLLARRKSAQLPYGCGPITSICKSALPGGRTPLAYPKLWSNQSVRGKGAIPSSGTDRPPFQPLRYLIFQPPRYLISRLPSG